MKMSKLEMLAGMSSEMDYQMTFPESRVNRHFFVWQIESWWGKFCDADNHYLTLSLMGNLDSPL